MSNLHHTVQILKIDLGEAAGGDGPRSITAEPSGKFIYMANLNSNDLWVYKINEATGLLTRIGKFPAGKVTRSVKTVLVTLPSEP